MLRFSASSSLPSNRSDVLIMFFFESELKLNELSKNIDRAVGGAVSRLLSSRDFNGKNGETVILYPADNSITKRLVILGLGKKSEFSFDSLRSASLSIPPMLTNSRAESITFVEPPAPQKASVGLSSRVFLESLLLNSYSFTEYRTNKEKKDEETLRLSSVGVVVSKQLNRSLIIGQLKRAEIISSAVNYARTLSNHPGNVMTPQTLADEAVKLAKQYRLRYRVYEKKDMEKMGMGALLGVNQGSVLPPKFIVLEYGKLAAKKTTVLVGKGITFDTGGISIKPSRKMEEMKYDMAGAATVLGIIKAAAELKFKKPLVGLIPATENMPSGSAIKPGDVVSAMNKKTIEVTNTDAEGRMVLADALCYASKYKPGIVIDYATLTGSAVAALGTKYTPVFSNNKKLLEKLKASDRISGERVWEMPLASEYKPKMRGSIADIDNVGSQVGAGTITGALFLEEFVDYPWIHLDVAGTASNTDDKGPKGATGVGVRLTVEYLGM